MIRRYDSWFSGSLQRPMELLHFGDRGYPVVMFPTSMGRFYQYEDMHTVDHLADKVDAGFIQLFCVDSVDAESWYDSSVPPAARAARHVQYDAYLRDELLPYVQRAGQRHDVGVFGCSFGAYHAANLAGRYPGVVTKAVCLSGIYDVHRFLDGYWDDNCYFNCPTAYVANMSDEWIDRLRLVQWVIATGEHDSLVQANRDFSSLLWSRGVPNHCEIWPGVFGHDWPWWNDAVRRFY
ncbi:MAG TPA: alpha/beta hydrolase-fold protein [Candidatus Acidoferrales bacterium]|nr:alpha/beta hydrolase-fold protein [Candidatus Acidoferrales bacterium]